MSDIWYNESYLKAFKEFDKAELNFWKLWERHMIWGLPRLTIEELRKVHEFEFCSPATNIWTTTGYGWSDCPSDTELEFWLKSDEVRIRLKND